MHSRSVSCMTGHYNSYYACLYVCVADKVSGGGFTCTYCKTHCSALMELRRHLSQHFGTDHHVLHCFFCRYCDYSSNIMDHMDDHVSIQHPTDPARYEVSVEKVAYLQNMMECPVCGGSFRWKSAFVQHCRSVECRSLL